MNRNWEKRTLGLQTITAPVIDKVMIKKERDEYINMITDRPSLYEM